jgi:hypothetical protein
LSSLHNIIFMNHELCVLLVFCVLGHKCYGWLIMYLSGIAAVFHLETKIPHIFCEPNQLSYLFCSDTFLNDMMTYFIVIILYRYVAGFLSPQWHPLLLLQYCVLHTIISIDEENTIERIQHHYVIKRLEETVVKKI